MITLQVMSFNGQPLSAPLSADLDETGGTIGRTAANQLVLPDPERHISRVHARVAFRDGGYAVIDQGSNPIQVNGIPLGNGNAARLKDGDELQIGGYAIRVRIGAPRAAAAPAPGASAASTVDPLGLFGGAPPAGGSDPFADLLGSPGQAVPPPGALGGVGASPPPAADPFAALGTASPPSPDPLLHPLAKPAPGGAAPAGGIPEDFDPFADPFAEPARPAAAAPAPRLPDDFGLGDLVPPAPQAPGAGSIDALFGIGAGSGTDPFAGGMLGEPAGQPNAAGLDPLATLTGAPQPAAASSLPDQVPELQGAFLPPAARPEAPAASEAGNGVFLSWEAGQGAASAPPARPKDDPLALFGASAGAGALDQGPTTAMNPEVPPRPRPQAAPYPPPQPAVPGVTGAAAAPELLQAFLAGLGTPQLQVAGGLTPELMERIGVLLREATQGTLDLLLARAMTKREVKAEVTMIVSRGNNPLKFSPDVSVALAHLVAPQGRGFLPPAAAMRDAYNDLRSHQFGFMAGMRAALAGVLARFDPDVLEKRLTQKTVLDSVLPMNRKAKLWDLFHELYRDISLEAEEDFHTLFGKAFLQAYEEQIDRLEAQDKAQRG